MPRATSAARVVFALVVLAPLAVGCAEDRWCVDGRATVESDAHRCLDEGLGPCAPRVEVAFGEVRGEPFMTCASPLPGACTDGVREADVVYARDGQRVRVSLFGLSRMGLLHGAFHYVDVPTLVGDGGLGSFCELRVNDLVGDDPCATQYVRCATSGRITVARDGSGEASVTFAEGDRIEARWRP